jgi:hypothetical protein
MLSLGAAMLAAQSSKAPLDKNFAFKDGVYLSFEQFQQNTPALGWDEVEALLVSNMQNYSAQAEYIRRKGGDTLAVEEIWGFALEGLPFIRITDTLSRKRAIAFAGLRVRGRICYFTFETEKIEQIPIAAYNPLTGKPFRKGVASRKAMVLQERILHFETGELRPFGRAALLDWMADDRQMQRTVEEMTEEEVAEKLFKCLLIYDDRNPVWIEVAKGG